MDPIDRDDRVRWHILGSSDEMYVTDEYRAGIAQTSMGDEAGVREDTTSATWVVSADAPAHVTDKRELTDRRYSMG